MNKLILVAVAGLCFGNIYAKNPKKDLSSSYKCNFLVQD